MMTFDKSMWKWSTLRTNTIDVEEDLDVFCVQLIALSRGNSWKHINNWISDRTLSSALCDNKLLLLELAPWKRVRQRAENTRSLKQLSFSISQITGFGNSSAWVDVLSLYNFLSTWKCCLQWPDGSGECNFWNGSTFKKATRTSVRQVEIDVIRKILLSTKMKLIP